MHFIKNLKTSFLILAFISAYSCSRAQNNNVPQLRGKVVTISTKDSRYFEKDGKTWVPVMINFIVPFGASEEASFVTIENYFKNFSSNGGDAMRIWISSPFLEIEDEKAGEYNPVKLKRIDRLLKLAEQYQIKIKFTLQHIRTISVKSSWSNSTVLSADNNGPFKDISEYVNTTEGKRSYLNRARALANRYKNSSQIFAWELWNEMDAVDSKDWLPFTAEILDSVKKMFPHHLVTQTLGSLHSIDAEKRYEDMFTLPQNDFISVHRYIDPGHDWQQYSNITQPTDLLVADAVNFAKSRVGKIPVVINEIGAVQGNHAGPSEMYKVDTAGVLIHDMVFAPFFSGAASSGGMWHWDSYVQKRNLWYHYARFKKVINGIDAATEDFKPFTTTKNGVRGYGLKGKTKTLIWFRDTSNSWKTELEQHIKAENKTGFSVSLNESKPLKKYKKIKVYDPWKDQWTEIKPEQDKLVLPSFLRSVILFIE